MCGISLNTGSEFVILVPHARKIVPAILVAIVAVWIGGQLAIQSGTWDVAMQRSGYVTYAVDCGLGPAAVGGAHDAFEAWDELNGGITLAESETWSGADVRVVRMNTPVVSSGPIEGCACIGVSPMCPILDNVLFGLSGCVIPKGGTIGIIVNESGVDEARYPYARTLMRDLIAHEFGHNLGMSHNTVNMSHMMYGPQALYPHTDRGYVIPEPIAGDDVILAASIDRWGSDESCVMP